jgi:hypothetical protein
MVALSPVPPGFAFVGLWLASVSLWQSRVLPVATGLWLGALAVALAAAGGLGRYRPRLSLGDVWGAGLLALAAFATPVMAIIALPAARAVRSVPAGLLAVDWLSISAAGASLPLLLCAGLGLTAVVLLLWRFPGGVSMGWRRRLTVPRLPENGGLRLGQVPVAAIAVAVYALIAALVIAVR